MRFLGAGLGLLSLLLGVAIILLVAAGPCSNYVGTVTTAGKAAREDAVRFSGRGPDEIANTQSVVLEPQTVGGQFRGLTVKSVAPGGAMDQYMGLTAGDVITHVNGMRISEISNDDVEMAKAQVAEAPQRMQTLTITRNGKSYTMPDDMAKAAAAPAGAAPANAPAAQQPQTEEPPSRDALQRQLDLIQRSPTH